MRYPFIIPTGLAPSGVAIREVNNNFAVVTSCHPDRLVNNSSGVWRCGTCGGRVYPDERVYKDPLGSIMTVDAHTTTIAHWIGLWCGWDITKVEAVRV